MSTPAASGATCEVLDLGLQPWSVTQELQMARVADVAAGRAGPALFLLEHEPVVTLGYSGNRSHLHVSEAELAQRGVALEHARRGGDVTCHFPGQLVAYVVLRLDDRKGGMQQLFHDLEECMLELLADFGIAGTRQEGRPGVWVEGRKIASVGLGMQRWVTFHGLALNVTNDLELFNLLTPCGLEGVEVTSLEQELAAAGEPRPLSMQEVKDVFVRRFAETVAPA